MRLLKPYPEFISSYMALSDVYNYTKLHLFHKYIFFKPLHAFTLPRLISYIPTPFL